MSEQNQHEASAEKWLTRARAARNTERNAEAKAATTIANVYDAHAEAARRSDEAAREILTDAHYGVIEDAMKARAAQVALYTAIALIEHLDDGYSPIEIVDSVQEQMVSAIVHRSHSTSQSTSLISTVQDRFELAAFVDVARIVGVR